MIPIEKKDKVDGKIKQKNKNKLFLTTMIILLVGIIGTVTIVNITKNSTKTANNNTTKPNNVTKNIITKNTKSSPKNGYSMITIAGLKCYVKTKYTNFTVFTDDNSYDRMDEYLEITRNDAVDFIDDEDFSQLYGRDRKFQMDITSISSKPTFNQQNINETDSNINSVKNINTDNTIIKIVHYNSYNDQNLNDEEFTYVYFQFKGKNIAIGWVRDQIDRYVIESFFKLN